MIELTWREFQQTVSEGSVAVIPVGSVEQHGLHAPLGTDLYIAQSMADAVNNEPNVLRLPVIPIGVSEYHRHFAGTLWVKPETLKAYVSEIILSLAGHGVRKVVIVNGHGGNREPLREMARALTMENEALIIVVWTWFESIENHIIQMFGRRPPLHADEAETGILAAVNPALVRPDKYAESSRGASSVWGKFFNGTMISQTVRDFSQSGATGDPVKTDEEQGARMKMLAEQNLKELIAHVSAL